MLPPAVRRDGGGAGGGPRLDLPPLSPVVWGEREETLLGMALGGGGGGARDLRSFSSAATAWVAFCCSRYCLMKPACSWIWSWVMPIARRSSSTP